MVIELIEKIAIKGKLELFNAKTGELLLSKDNLVVDTGLYLTVDRLKSNAVNPFTHIGIGTDATPAVAGNTVLGAEIFRKAISDIDTVLNVLTAETIIADSEAIATWREVAIFNAAAAGMMFNRIIINFIKTTIDAVRIRFTITVLRA